MTNVLDLQAEISRLIYARDPSLKALVIIMEENEDVHLASNCCVVCMRDILKGIIKERKIQHEDHDKTDGKIH